MPAGIGHIAETHMISPEARCRVFARWRSVSVGSKSKVPFVGPVLRARAPRACTSLSLTEKKFSRKKLDRA